MFREKQANMRANGATRRLRKAMAVVLTIAMVSTQTPLASAADRAVQAAASEQAQSATPSVQSEQPLQDAQADAQPAQNAQAAAPGEAAAPAEAGDVEVALTFDHAYIEVDGQVIAAPATKVTLPANRDARIFARADEGYAVSRVTLAASGATTTLEAGADGAYVISADQLAGATALSVAATPAQGTQSASDAVPLDQEKKDEFTFEDDAVKVTAKLEKSGAIPADATLRVTPVAPDSGAYNYNAYLDALNGAAADGKQHNEKNTLMYDVAFVTRGADGALVEVQPAEGSVSVSFQFKQGQISRGLAADSAADVQVTHLPLTDAARRSAKTTAEATSIAATDVSVESLSGSDVRAKGADAIEVKTDSLSVFALSYTVDFTYDGYAYSLPGEGSIRLSELFSALGISASAADATSVEFSNPDLVEVARDGSDWRLTSRAPFLTRETLTVHMADGSTYVVNVTDAQTSSDLAAFLTDANIVAPTNAEGAYVVVPGSSYSIKLSFHENKSLQFPDDGRTMTYKLPEGLNADGHEGKFDVKVNDGGTVYTVGGNSYHITGDTLYVNLNTSDANFSHLSAASNLVFTLSFEGSIAEDAKKIHFSDGVEKSVDVDTSNSVTASKSAVVNKDRGTVDYTVAIVSKGHSKNVKVHDAIEGRVLSLDASSVRATSNKGHAVDLRGGASGNTLDYTIPDMADGEVVTLTYSATIDVSKIPVHDGKVITSGTNKVSVKSDGDPTPHDTEIHTTIDYTPDVYKEGGKEVSSDGHTKTLRWTINANGEALVSMANMRITDTIDEQSRQIMKYSGDGLEINVKDRSGRLVRTDHPSWSDLAHKDDGSWTYQVPSSDAGKAYRYEISYTTVVDLTNQTTQATVKNTVTTDGGKGSTGEAHVTPIGDNKVEAYKSVEKVDYEAREITWRIDFTVPAEGLSLAEVTDDFPHQYVNGHEVYERVKDGSIDVRGLVDGETYDVSSGEKSVTLTFYQDSQRNQAGLKGGKERTISVELKTEINDEIVAASKHQGEQWRETHQNHGQVKTNIVTKPVDNQVSVVTPDVSKSAKCVGTRNVGGVELPVWRFEVTLSRVNSQTNTVFDEYDTSLLEPIDYGYDAWRVYGGNAWYLGFEGGTFSHVATDKGMRFDVPADALPHNDQSTTGYHDLYRLVYYLTVKDEAALQKLIDKSVTSPDDHLVKIHNGVTWNDHTDGVDVDYEYQALKKEMLTPDSELSKTDQDVRAKFRITLNPAGAMLNDGNPLTMTDTVDHLSVDPESIKASVPGVTWDVQGHTVTYKIPDATPVTIEYEAHVVFSEAAQAGEKKIVTFSNKAEMNGYTQDVEKKAERTNSGTATASVPSVKLLKYEAGNMGQRLGGATFALLDENKQPVEGNSGAVTITTKADGTATIRGDQAAQGWTLDEGKQYYLRETHAPQGHMLTGDDIPFKITLDGTSDPDHGIYEMGDTLTVKNYPGTDVHVEKSWSDGSGRHGSDSVVVRLQQRIAGGDWSDTIREHVGDADSAWTDTPAKDLTISAGTNWEGSFKNLPLAVPASLSDPDADDVSVEYRVIETQVNGKAPEEGTSDVKVVPPSSEDGSYLVKVTNTPKAELTEASVRKAWDDADNQDGMRPGEVKVTLTANGARTAHTETLSEGNNWSAKVADLPKTDDAGREIDYAWVEDAEPDGYAVSGNTKDGTVTTITNRHVPKKTSATVKKAWADADNQDGKRPQSIEVALLANGKTVRTVTLSEKGGWTQTVGDLPVYEGGNKIDYKWSEESRPDGYEVGGTATSGTVTTITNRHTPETVGAKVQKVWDDADDLEGFRPKTIDVELRAGSRVVRTATLSAENGWSASAEGLPKYEGGHEVSYSWDEKGVPSGYKLSTSVEGDTTTLTNTHDVETTSASVKKVWVDDNNQDGKRPQSITVTLTANGKKTDRTVTLSEASGWSATLDGLQKYQGGKAVAYGWSEDGLADGYELTGDVTDAGVTTLTNSRGSEKTEATVRKVWADADNQDGKRPESIKVTLLANGQKTDHTVTLSAANNWTAKVEGLDRNKDGKPIAYTWDEGDAPEGYRLTNTATTGTVTTLTNTHDVEKTKASVKKVWNDANNQDGKRPDAIVVTLQKKVGDADWTDATLSGAVVQRTLSADNDWSASVDELPKYEGGREVTYGWTEKDVPSGYKLSTDTKDGATTLTNTHEVEKCEATVRKVWDDANNQDGKRPSEIKVTLAANGTATDHVVTLSDANSWTATVSDLPAFVGGQKVTYTWSEEGLPAGYAISGTATDAGVTTITNKHDTKTTGASVRKVWVDANDQDGARPASIVVTLQKKVGDAAATDVTENGKPVERTLSADNDWSASVDSLPAFEGGREVAYSWAEKDVPSGYTLATDTKDGVTTLTNTHEVEKTEATVSKVWDDANDQDGRRPASIKVTLLANGAKVDEVTLDAKNGWSATVSGLDKKAAGKDIAYTWNEGDAPAGYTLVSNATDGTLTTLTNKHDVEKTKATVKKVWDDADNQDGIRPGELKVRLSSGQEVTLNDANGWSATVDDLPVYVGGQKVTYTWSEEGLPAGYKLTKSETDGELTTITNTREVEKTEASVKKVWEDANDQDGKRPSSIKVALLANGEKIDEVTLDQSNGWSATVSGLNKKAAGNDITYTWAEGDAPEGYRLTNTATTGTVTTLTNKHEVEKTKASVKKVWDDADNQDGKRPESIKVALKAGDAKVDEVTLDAKNDWSAEIGDLPAFAGGQKVTYTWSEEGLPAGYALSGTVTEGELTTITNAHAPETTSASVKKDWADANNQDGKRPASIIVTLQKSVGGAAATDVTDGGKPVERTLSDESGWKASVDGLPKYEGGKLVAYSWAEKSVPAGYALSTDTKDGATTLTNTHEVEKTEASVKKVWDDANNQDGKRPSEIRVTLTANGKATDHVVTLSEANKWTATVSGLDKFQGGKEVAYSWSEDGLPEGYELLPKTVAGTVTTLTNSYKPEQTSATVSKAWDDANDQDGMRPESIKVTLLADGEPTEHTVTLSQDNKWTDTVSGLDKMKDGHAISYTWREDEVPEGYAATTATTGTTTTITNTHELAKTEASVRKVWDDDSSAGAHRPQSLDVHLLANGQQAKDASGADIVARLDQSNNWSATVRDLPVNAQGKAIRYTWSEGDMPAGYKLSGTAIEGTTTTLTNTYDASAKLSFKGTKHMSGRPFVAGDDYTFTMVADDAKAPLSERASVRIAPTTGEVATLDFGDVTYTLADAGKTYTYTISESGSSAGVTNDSAKTVKVSIADAGDGTLKVTTVEGDAAKLDFTNTYEATGSLELKGTKSMEGRELAEGDHFEFDVAEEGGKTVTVGNTGSKIDYPTLSYTLADLGTHTYTVSEHKVDKDGVKSDGRTYTMVVTVADEVRDGKLEVTYTGADPAKLDFTNTYDTRADFPLDAHKTIEGRDFGKGAEADRYTFSVTADDAKAPLPERSTVTITPTSGRDAAIDFGKIAFTLADAGKTYTYTIRESGTVAGVTNSAAKTVTLKVTDDGKGNLKVERTGGDELPLAFKNTYDAKGTATVQATKSLVGRAWKPGETYAFAIEAKAGAPEPEVKRAIATAQGVPASFGAISYTLADAGKTFDYTIREIAPTDDKGNALTEKDGVAYTSDTHTAHVSVSDKGDGTLTTRVTYDLNRADAPTFQNTYGAAGTTTLEATKTIEGRDFNENDAYTFTVSASTAGAPMPEHPSVTIKPREGRTAAIDFGTIAYTLDDAGKTYVYDVTESAQVAGVTNDTRTHRVTVRVTDAGNGTLSVEKSFATAGETSAALVFANAYDAKGSHELHATKTVSGRDFNEGDSYTFTVRADDAKAPMPERTSVTIDPREGRSAAVDFGKIDYALADAGKAYTYTIVESGTVAGVTNDVRTHTVTVKVTDNGDGTLACTEDARVDGLPTRGTTFNNAYAATGEATLDVHKTLEGRDLKAGEFTFELADDAGRVLQTATNDADGTVAFAPLAYDLASLGEGTTDARAKSRTLHYTVKEKLPAGVGEKSPRQDATTFDTATHDVYVTLTDNGAGTIETSVDYGQGNARCEFRNKHFSAAETLEFEKHYYGADRNASFTFELTAATADWQPRSGSPASQIDAAGRDFVVDSGQAFTLVAHNGTFDEAGTSKVTLPALRYYEPGTYRYVLSERHASAAANDAAVYHVTVEVASDQTVRRTIELVYGGQTSAVDAMAFYNNDQVTLGFTSSALAPQDDANRTASVEPKARKRFDNGSLVAGEFAFSLRDADGRALQTVTNDALGNVAFDRLTFGEPGTYNFTLTEDPGTDPGIVYDSHAISYRVTVTADAKGVLSAKEAYLGSDGKAIDEATFVNDVRTIEIRAQKRSREAPYDPLAGATYGIWMANGSGNDVYMGNAVSDADGYLRYEVPTTQGVAYYLREEKAPHGHLVDPYPTDYFTIGKGANGAFYLVYQYDSDFFALVPDLKGKI